MSLTTDPNDPNLNVKSEGGQNKTYLVLSDEELAKGFVRPVRDSYIHRGIRPKYPVRVLTDEESVRHEGRDYVGFEPYPESEAPVTGRYWTAKQMTSGCGSLTTMGRKLAETYASDPEFYGATFCVKCNAHFPVEEFVWEGTDERVGS